MNYLWLLAAGFVLGWLLKEYEHEFRKLWKKEQREKDKGSGESEESPVDFGELYKIADRLQKFYDDSAQPKDLLTVEDFKKGVALFDQEKHGSELILSYAIADNIPLACMALEALTRRGPDQQVSERLLTNLPDTYLWPLYFVLRYLGRHAQDPVIGRVLARIQKWWRDYPATYAMFDAFLKERLEHGEKLTWGVGRLDVHKMAVRPIRAYLKNLDKTYREPLLSELAQIEATVIDTEFLNSVGKIWTSSPEQGDLIEFDGLTREIQQMEHILLGAHPQSFILVGPSGIGKTTIIQLLAHRLHNQGWRIFEGSATEILAGQMYIGQLEERMQQILDNLQSGRRIIWLIPNIHEMNFAGRHRYSQTGVLDMILPHVESGRLLVIGEIEPQPYERLVQENRRVRSAFTTLRLQPVPDEVTLHIAREWNRKQAASVKRSPPVPEKLIDEALQLCKQFLNDKAAPGNLLNLLKQTKVRLTTIEGPLPEIKLDDLFVTVSQATGLPQSILDERQGLNLKDLRATFEGRVMGQAEAIDCLVERVAMIKAGLSDPGRPYGVFLFAGPTGTGKTEIAKTLASFLFGSHNRMIRLDMSEFKNPEALERITGSPDMGAASESLATLIRKQPFSVILLDEFEKAHFNVWDLFLQIFDDGRLTDRQGNTADFRHAIIILTSNLGARIPTGLNVGFSESTAVFSKSEVDKTIRDTFRPEFINRLDRTIVFHPLSRQVMREILYKELDQVMTRRGLRNRQWCVEWEESAIEFLLQKGFTLDMGARPLKRAIEQYLLSPLALTIVTHQLPDGDQFLFVRSNGNRIQVEFIDPDAPDPAEEEDTPVTEAAADREVTLTDIILHPRGQNTAVEVLQQEYDRLSAGFNDETWQQQKALLTDQISTAGFWDDPRRFSVLGEIEYRDRMETALETAGSLLRRLRPERARQTTQSVDLLQRLAMQLYLVDRAWEDCAGGQARDVFVIVEGRYSSHRVQRAQILECTDDLAGMYVRWAERRRMQLLHLNRREDTQAKSSLTILSVSGLGAYSILSGEQGLHVWEFSGKEKATDRCQLRVHILQQAESPYTSPKEMLDDALQRLKQAPEPETQIVRHYKMGNNALVKDQLRGWRTGRVDDVLDGNFDLYHI